MEEQVSQTVAGEKKSETTPDGFRSEAPVFELGMSKDEMDLMPLRKMFDIPGNNFRDNKNLETILGWAQSKGIADRDVMRLELRRIEMKLGAPSLGESRIAQIARYLILDGKANNALKEMQSYEK